MMAGLRVEIVQFVGYANVASLTDAGQIAVASNTRSTRGTTTMAEIRHATASDSHRNSHRCFR